MGKHWVDGIYSFSNESCVVHQIKGEVALWRNLSELDYPEYCPHTDDSGSWKYGDFGEATKELQEKTGVKNYNLRMTYWGGIINQNAILSKDGKSVTCLDPRGRIDVGKHLSKEELKELMDSRESISTPSMNYKVQPDNQGKIIWLSGPPGAGKSTSGLLLAKKYGYVYYEADGFMFGVNPYVPLDATEPSLATMSQPPLKGKSFDAVKACVEIGPEFPKMMAGAPYDQEKCIRFYTEMAKDVQIQMQRIGGTFAVAHAIPNKKFRNVIRDILGDQVIFVSLVLSRETNIKRCEARHSKGDKEMQKSFLDAMTKMFETFEPIQKDEKKSVNVIIEPEMTRDNVVDEILNKIKIFL